MPIYNYCSLTSRVLITRIKIIRILHAIRSQIIRTKTISGRVFQWVLYIGKIGEKLVIINFRLWVVFANLKGQYNYLSENERCKQLIKFNCWNEISSYCNKFEQKFRNKEEISAEI